MLFCVPCPFFLCVFSHGWPLEATITLFIVTPTHSRRPKTMCMAEESGSGTCLSTCPCTPEADQPPQKQEKQRQSDEEDRLPGPQRGIRPVRMGGAVEGGDRAYVVQSPMGNRDADPVRKASQCIGLGHHRNQSAEAWRQLGHMIASDSSKILLPIGKAPQRGREYSQSISHEVRKSFRRPRPPSKHPNRVKNTNEGLKHALHRIFDRLIIMNSQSIKKSVSEISILEVQRVKTA